MALRKVVALYDIHGNLPALEAVLSEIAGMNADCVVLGGDLVWGPDPAGVLGLLMCPSWPRKFVRGNTDREVACRENASQGMISWEAEVTRWCTEQLTSTQLTFLKQLPLAVSLNIGDLGAVKFVHGSPRRDDEAIRIDTPESAVIQMLQGIEEGTVVSGHTHVRMDRVVSDKRIVNPGSVGVSGIQGRAYWALFTQDIEFRETSYEWGTAVSRMRQSRMPYIEKFLDEMSDT